MTAYRRRRRSDCWHFHPKCRWWPEVPWTIKSRKPTSGELCNECQAKARRDEED